MNTSWNEYFKNTDKDKVVIVTNLMEIAGNYMPDGYVKTISYGMPTLDIANKHVISIAAFKEHLSIFPHGSSVVNIVKDKINAESYDKGTIRFSYNKLPNKKDLKIIVTAKLKEIN